MKKRKRRRDIGIKGSHLDDNDHRVSPSSPSPSPSSPSSLLSSLSSQESINDKLISINHPYNYKIKNIDNIRTIQDYIDGKYRNSDIDSSIENHISENSVFELIRNKILFMNARNQEYFDNVKRRKRSVGEEKVDESGRRGKKKRKGKEEEEEEKRKGKEEEEEEKRKGKEEEEEEKNKINDEEKRRENDEEERKTEEDEERKTKEGEEEERRRRRHRRKGRGRRRGGKHGLSLWIDRQQVKMFSGYVMEIPAIHEGHVLPYILDPEFENHLPVIPSEVMSVNFTWAAGRRRYQYVFEPLYSQDEAVLRAPVVSVPTRGRVPRKPKVFSVKIQCTGNASGVVTFGIGLLIQTVRGRPLPGTPLRLQLRKECAQMAGPDPECDKKCANGGVCGAGQRCQCPEGYMGQYCHTALCYPQCMNGGTCTTPGRCSCPAGYQGRHCEGGICRNQCLNGGKCVQKDTCACPKGYYGNRCEFSKCLIPCINGGRCRDVNKCRCPRGFQGDHCEVVLGASAGAGGRCERKCRHGSCVGASCRCQQGYHGRWCRRREAPLFV